LAECVKYAVAFGRKRKKTKTASISIPGISIGVTGEVKRRTRNSIPLQSIYSGRAQFAAPNMKMAERISMANPRYSITYCSGMGIGLLAISSCAIGLLIAMVLVSKDSPLVISRI